MQYKSFQELSLSALGFGTMRLPLIEGGGATDIDMQTLDKMVDLAMEGGVNYFDTAYPYHGGYSEIAIGKSLSRYPRESFYLANKFPGHQNVKGVKQLIPEEIFEEQLKKCGVDYFDFYLLHNINENSMQYYGNKDNHYLEYFLAQKEAGRIKHLGFSCHSAPEGLEDFLKLNADSMEFCQIQLNYVDWTLQDAKKKVELLESYGIPIWVMEPVRGGRLASFGEGTEAKLRSMRPDESIAAWSFRWLETVPKPTMVLSGMSSIEQMKDNIKTFSEEKPLNAEELEALNSISERFMSLVPCTACRYCCDGCPMELNIPNLISLYNDLTIDYSVNPIARYGAIDESKRADACIACGQCSAACPQMIDVPSVLKAFADKMASTKTWEEICIDRAKAAELAKNA